MRKTAEEISGLEYDWLGMDSDGHVALFSTAGGGYPPNGFLQDTEVHYAAISVLLSLPETTKAVFSPELPPHCVNAWRLAAQRGLFAFDSDLDGGPYRRVAAPELPSACEQLPAIVQAAVKSVQLQGLRFSELSEISGSRLEGL